MNVRLEDARPQLTAPVRTIRIGRADEAVLFRSPQCAIDVANSIFIAPAEDRELCTRQEELDHPESISAVSGEPHPLLERFCKATFGGGWVGPLLAYLVEYKPRALQESAREELPFRMMTCPFRRSREMTRCAFEFTALASNFGEIE
jgi:hypothetical protein